VCFFYKGFNLYLFATLSSQFIFEIDFIYKLFRLIYLYWASFYIEKNYILSLLYFYYQDSVINICFLSIYVLDCLVSLILKI
jgi:hypothetical protein